MSWTAPDFGDRADLPTVLVTFGTVFGGSPVVSTILSSLSDQPLNTIATVGPYGDACALDVDGGRVHIERFAPLDRLLAAVSAVVSHGGGGTILGTLSRGLPLVLLPRGADQFINAEQVAGAGAGITLLPTQVSPDAIRAAVERALIDRSLRDGAQRVAGEIGAMDSPDAVLERLEQLESPRVVVAA